MPVIGDHNSAYSFKFTFSTVSSLYYFGMFDKEQCIKLTKRTFLRAVPLISVFFATFFHIKIEAPLF